jgi:aspartate aminotransferase-like enzyme
MINLNNLVFKIASKEEEFDQIHRLNYRTFVEEIPQHPQNTEKKLIDKFHNENTYIIGLNNNEELIGMVCVRSNRPFSIDKKVDNIDALIPTVGVLCEIRLLSVKEEFRSGFVFFGLMKKLSDYCNEMNYSIAVISGTTRQLNLYKHLGFIPFGNLVGEEGAKFQPMYLTMQNFKKSTHKIVERKIGIKNHINLLPGPCTISKEVQKKFNETAVSHRNKSFYDDFNKLKGKLCSFLNSKYVHLVVGSGTLANETVSAQLSLLKGKGIILSNGEFGQRLISQAERFGLDFEKVTKQWGESFLEEDLRIINDCNRFSWLWAVHCETSTGVLNDIELLKKICFPKKIKICLDCISSIASVPIDLSEIYLATGVSGKAIGAYPGISMVFYNHKIESNKGIPKYFDIGFFQEEEGIPFTISSNLFYALECAVGNVVENIDIFNTIQENFDWLRRHLLEMGFNILADSQISSPSVLTIALPAEVISFELGEWLERNNCFLSFRSKYLIERNLIQCYLTGNSTRKELIDLVGLLREYFIKTNYN